MLTTDKVGPGDIAINKMDKVPSLLERLFKWENTGIKQRSKYLIVRAAKAPVTRTLLSILFPLSGS